MTSTMMRRWGLALAVMAGVLAFALPSSLGRMFLGWFLNNPAKVI